MQFNYGLIFYNNGTTIEGVLEVVEKGEKALYDKQSERVTLKIAGVIYNWQMMNVALESRPD